MSKSNVRGFKFPNEIKDLISTLKDQKQWTILELLLNRENRLSYTEIKELLGITDNEKGTLNYHLKELQNIGLLKNWVESGTDLADRKKSYYGITEFGMKIIDGVMQSMDRSSYTPDATPKIEKSSVAKSYKMPSFEIDAVAIKEQVKSKGRQVSIIDNSNSDSRLHEHKLSIDKLRNELSKFGLTANQSKVYIFLGKYGSKTATEVLHALEIPRTETYRLLTSLQNKGIVSATFQHPIKFSALPLNKALYVLLNAEQERLKGLVQSTDELERVWNSVPFFDNDLPVRSEGKFQMLQGINQVASKINEIITTTKVGLQILGSEKDFMRFYHAGFLESISNSKIESELITSSSEKTLYVFDGKLKEKVKRTTIKITENLGFIIKDDEELLLFMKNTSQPSEETVAMWTDSESMISPMKLLFDRLWNESKPLDTRVLPSSDSVNTEEMRRTSSINYDIKKYLDPNMFTFSPEMEELIPKGTPPYLDNGERYVERIARALSFFRQCALIGPRGTGKTHVVYLVAELAGLPLWEINCGLQTSVFDLIGRYVGQGKENWVDGIITSWCRHGGILYLDEANMMKQDIATRLNPVWDQRGHMILTEKDNEIIQRHNDAFLIVSMNPVSSEFSGTKPINAAIRRRISTWLNFDYMSVGPRIDEKEIDLVVRKTGIERKDAEKIIKVGAELRKQYKDGELPYGPSIGDLLNWAKLVADGIPLYDAAEETIIALASNDMVIQEIVRKLVHKKTDEAGRSIDKRNSQDGRMSVKEVKKT